MPLSGYVEYQRREYCKDVRCLTQMELEAQPAGSAEYERVRQLCQTACRHTTWEFHHWLMDKGYLILKAQKGGP